MKTKLSSIAEYIKQIPKAELHIHIEGTLKPELMLKLAKRNQVKIKYDNVEEIKEAYHFKNLADFLKIYYEGMKVLKEEQDFYDLTWSYLEKISAFNVRHVEIFFDPQSHMNRGILFSTVIQGIHRALEDGQRLLNISAKLIMCFLRDLSEADAIHTLEEAMPFKNLITGVGLDSNEVGHPPAKFVKVYEMARNAGFLAVAHAGETGPAEYIWQALDLLKVSRVDHGNHCLEDPKLVDRLVKDEITLTVCPLSNLKLHVVESLQQHPLKHMLDLGLKVTINSDDPAYFGGYLEENIQQTEANLQLNKKDIYQLEKNAFVGSFLPESQKQQYLQELDEFFHAHS